MDFNKLCMGCMNEKPDTNICPSCGFSEDAPQESPIFLPPRTILHGQYLLGKVLGHGGFGITYIAFDLNLETKLAIKEYMPEGLVTRVPGSTTVSIFSGERKDTFNDGVEKFLDEAKMLAKFNENPCIVNIRNFFRENGTAYIVMGYVEGRSLKQYLQDKGKISFEEAKRVIMPVMDALKHVHSIGMLHRDISPDNIYITKEGAVKLLDFGAARYVMGEHSRSLSVILKPGYAPEEQYRTRGKQGPWTDVYSTAATLYRMITGVAPSEALDRLEYDDVKHPSDLCVNIKKHQENALMKALSIRGHDRFQTIKEFQDELFKSESETITQDSKQIKEAISTSVNKTSQFLINKSSEESSSKEVTEGYQEIKYEEKEKIIKDVPYNENNDSLINSFKVGPLKKRFPLKWAAAVISTFAIILLILTTNKTSSETTESNITETVKTSTKTPSQNIPSAIESTTQKKLWIYFSDGSTIYRVLPDGTNRLKVNNEEAYSKSYENGWIYYRNKNDKLCKMTVDGTNIQQISSDTVGYVSVLNGWIYYSSWTNDRKLYKMRTDGTGKVKLGDVRAYDIVVYGDYVYFRNEDDNNKLYKISTTGTDMRKVVDDAVYGLAVNSGWLYYINESDNNKIYKISVVGSSREIISDDEAWFISSYGDYIYYATYIGEIYKIKNYGLGKQKVCDNGGRFLLPIEVSVK